MKGSFNDRVRQAVAKSFQVEEIFATAQAADAAEMAVLERQRVWTALRDLARYGEVEALGQGRWRRRCINFFLTHLVPLFQPSALIAPH